MGVIPGRWAGAGKLIPFPGGRQALLVNDPVPSRAAGGHVRDECGHGHTLRSGPGSAFVPGSVHLLFVYCQCPSARDVQGTRGHVAVVCAGCQARGRLTAFCDPPCHVPATGQEPR